MIDRIFESKIGFAITVAVFVAGLTWNANQGAGLSLPGHGVFAPQLTAAGPTIPPDPWTVAVAAGPTIPPDPWTAKAGPTIPPDPWTVAVAAGPLAAA